MFKKLLSNLPFNPSLIGQVAFYARRLNREAAFRRGGLVIMSLALVVQVFAVVSPPQSSLASSSSDLITGGFSSRSDALSYCRKDVRDFKKILNYYGITCAAVADATTVSIKPKGYDKKLYSMGRLAYGVVGEQPVKVPEVGTLYVRHFWSLNYADSYKALKVRTSEGKTVFILFSCGNLVSIGVPEPAPPAPPQEPKDVCPNKPGLQTKAEECDVCPELPGEQSADSECRSCTDSQTRDDLTACLDYRKTASNKTQGLSDANGTTAQANDVIEYTLRTSNQGKVTVKNYVVNENISDILDYAVVVDLQGGIKDENNVVSWPAGDIQANQSIEQKLTVRIKDPIPNTPVSSSDGGHFNMIMTNVYGNTVNIKLPPTLVKTTEVVVTEKLPNTGPGTSLMIVGSLTVMMAYFFARSRLFAKELDLVRTDYGSVGGY